DAKREERRQFLRRHADEVSDRAEKVQIAQKAVDDYRPRVEAARRARQARHALTCPHCAGEVMLDAEQRALVPYEAPEPAEPGAFTLEQLEEGLGVLERTLLNRERDLQQAQ